jgi:uncharacterized protein YydD (DUF2326 family)
LNIRERIQTRLDELASLLESQAHIHVPELVTEKLESVAKFWSALSEEEREYISSVRFAFKEGLEWKTDVAGNCG